MATMKQKHLILYQENLVDDALTGLEPWGSRRVIQLHHLSYSINCAFASERVCITAWLSSNVRSWIPQNPSEAAWNREQLSASV